MMSRRVSFVIIKRNQSQVSIYNKLFLIRLNYNQYILSMKKIRYQINILNTFIYQFRSLNQNKYVHINNHTHLLFSVGSHILFPHPIQ